MWSATPRDPHPNIDDDSVIEVPTADGCFTPSFLDVPGVEDGSGSLGEDDPDLGRAWA